jgi:hypothetical protein
MQPGFRIRNDLIAVLDTDPDPALFFAEPDSGSRSCIWIPDPDPSFDNRKVENKIKKIKLQLAFSVISL